MAVDPSVEYFLRSCSDEDDDIDRMANSIYIVHMNAISFTWDERKNLANRRKHGISFKEAQTVFYDENAIRYFDPDHSTDEDRFIMLGLSYRLRMLVVCHCFRESESIIRIISARKANRQEARAYWKDR
jgi:uncharacterized DUF497 family protein